MDKEERGFRHLTLLQIRYLIELEKTDKKRGTVAEIAKNCGASHGPVSTFLKECVRDGYLTENYEFTRIGKAELDNNKELVKETQDYLDRIGVAKEQREETLRNLIGSLDQEALLRIVRSDRAPGRREEKQGSQRDGEKGKWKANHFLTRVLDFGNYDVLIDVHRIREEGEIRSGLSMADRGFEHIGRIRHNKRGSWLDLTILDMSADAGGGGRPMTGHLSTLKYIKDGMMIPVEIRGRKLSIRLDAFKFRRAAGEQIQGYLPITVTCNVGTAYMPESTAILSFYL